jgi:glucose-1-phosphate cytidylyltransferase
MVNIGPRPILWHIMKTYACYGHTDYILPLGYKGHMIKDYFCHYELMNSDVTIELGKPESFSFHQKHDEVGWKITLAETGIDALKGNRIKQVEKYVRGNTFLLTYGDGVANIDIDCLIDFHRSHGKLATVTGVNPLSRFGELKLKGDIVSSFIEKPKENDGGLISAGFFVFERRIFDYLTMEESCDLEYGALETIAREGQLMVYRHDGFWSCMDTLRDMEMLNTLWVEGRAPWKIW